MVFVAVVVNWVMLLCLCVHIYAAVSAAKDAVGQIDVNKAMEYKAKFDELTSESDETSKKDD